MSGRAYHPHPTPYWLDPLQLDVVRAQHLIHVLHVREVPGWKMVLPLHQISRDRVRTLRFGGNKYTLYKLADPKHRNGGIHSETMHFIGIETYDTS
jgi:hypothetical protein